MAEKIDLVAPQPPVSHGHAPQGVVPSSAMMVQRWLKNVGDKIVAGEPLVELVGNQVVFYVHAPGNGTLSGINIASGQNVLSGHLLGQASIVSKDEIEWDNLDQVTVMLSDFVEKAQDFKSLKDANEALGQLLGVEENQAFFKMSTEEQNQFLQSVIDQSEGGNITASEIARKMLVDLNLRPPQFAPYAPQTPNFGLGMRAPAPAGPGGMGGGMGGHHHAVPHYPPNNTMPPSGYYDPQAFGQNPNFVATNPVIPQPHAYPSYPVTPAHQSPHGLIPPSDPVQLLPPITEDEENK